MNTSPHPAFRLSPSIAFMVVCFGVAVAKVGAFTTNPFAPMYSQFDDSVEYDYVRCSPSKYEAEVIVEFEADRAGSKREIGWFFCRDTMTKVRYDSMMRAQQLNLGSAMSYVVPTCVSRTRSDRGKVVDTTTRECEQLVEPVLLPRRNKRTYVLWNGIAQFEMARDTTLSIVSGKAKRNVSIRVFDGVRTQGAGDLPKAPPTPITQRRPN